MSAILEEGIGFGGNDDQDKSSTNDSQYNTGEANFPNRHNDPFIVDLSPLKEVTDLDPALEKMKKERTPVTQSNQTPDLTTYELKENFNKQMHTVVQKTTPAIEEDDSVCEADIEEIIKELEAEAWGCEKETSFTPSALPKKSLEETKEMLKTFHKKVSEYPKHLSYEGSVVLCVLLAMNPEGKTAFLNKLPEKDQSTIRDNLPEKFKKYPECFRAEFDEDKDFKLTFSMPTTNEDSNPEKFTLNMFNTVAHPRPEDLQDVSAPQVPIENDGDKVAVGGKIVFDKKRAAKLIGTTNEQQHKDQEKEYVGEPRRQPVAGRNAYEIRADVLQMAIDWLNKNNKYGQEKSTEEVLTLAKKFYTFVENRR